MKLWQLKKISTGEGLNDPQPLPKNWNGILGMNGFLDKIGDLSWRGLEDQGWFEVDVPDTEISTSATKKVVDIQIEQLLKESLQYVAVDNLSITKGERADWIEYRRLVKEIPLQADYPNNIFWPKRPDIE